MTHIAMVMKREHTKLTTIGERRRELEGVLDAVMREAAGEPRRHRRITR
jgi:hypothetical protein